MHKNSDIEFDVFITLDGVGYAVKGRAKQYMGYVEELFLSDTTRDGEAYDPYQLEGVARLEFKRAVLKAIDYLLPKFS